MHRLALMSSPKSNVARSRLAVTLQHLSAGARISSNATYSTKSHDFSSKSLGAKYTGSFVNYAVKDNKVVSYFHDLPLSLDPEAKTATMVVEIPRWSNGKFEISTSLPGNPIKQDTKKGKVRFVKNLFPYHGYIHNYGALPQTWEDPTVKSEVDGLFGDGDPLDVCEIGSEILTTGSVKTVKILGSLALVDDGELDWKVIAVNVEDPLAQELFDIHDVFVKCPGLLESTRQWFRDYKLADGKGENKFALNGAYRGQKDTMETIVECHEAWRKLVEGKTSVEGFSLDNVTVEGTPGHVNEFEFGKKVLESAGEPDGELPADVHKSYFMSSD